MATMNVFLHRLDTDEVKQLFANAEKLWADRQAMLNSRLREAQIPVRVAGMETVWTVLYDVPGRYHWMLQYYLREQGVALSWVGSGRMIMSLNFDDAMFEELCNRFVQAAKNMQQDGWWWASPQDQQSPIRRQVFKEMLKARWASS
jgi:glutamate-1-semialdehyde 2,1-aminomutase